jgi:sulfate transport system permease protein
MANKKTSVLPGFKLTLGYTLLYLGLIVLIPLAGTFWKTSALTWDQFWHIVTAPRVMASYRLSFGASFLAAFINLFFGLLVAWVLVRYQFWGKRFVDALVDLPFALPTAVAGIALTAIYAPNGWIGHRLAPLGIKVAYTQLGILVALTFIGLPFIVRTVQPVLEDFDLEIEESAASLGANRWQTFWRVTLPMLRPALLTGFTLAFARALGEYGSVVFISSKWEKVIPMLIFRRLSQYEFGEAAAIAVVTLAASFVILLFINLTQWWSRRYAA